MHGYGHAIGGRLRWSTYVLMDQRYHARGRAHLMQNITRAPFSHCHQTTKMSVNESRALQMENCKKGGNHPVYMYAYGMVLWLSRRPAMHLPSPQLNLEPKLLGPCNQSSLCLSLVSLLTGFVRYGHLRYHIGPCVTYHPLPHLTGGSCALYLCYKYDCSVVSTIWQPPQFPTPPGM